MLLDYVARGNSSPKPYDGDSIIITEIIQWLNHMLEVATMKFKPGNMILEARLFTVAIYVLVSWNGLNPI